jgi:hypothetical protein
VKVWCEVGVGGGDDGGARVAADEGGELPGEDARGDTIKRGGEFVGEEDVVAANEEVGESIAELLAIGEESRREQEEARFGKADACEGVESLREREIKAVDEGAVTRETNGGEIEERDATAAQGGAQGAEERGFATAGGAGDERDLAGVEGDFMAEGFRLRAFGELEKVGDGLHAPGWGDGAGAEMVGEAEVEGGFHGVILMLGEQEHRVSRLRASPALFGGAGS